MKKETAISFFLACAVVVGMLWVVSESEFRESKRNQSMTDTQARVYSSRSYEQLDQVSPANPESNAVGQDDGIVQGQVFKCIANGKTTYSNGKCSAGAKTQQVQLHDTVGVVSPPKAVLAELTAQRHAAESVYDQQMQKQVSATVQSPKMECDALDKRIEWLNAMARQPQPGQTQDWIKQEKMNAQSRQYAIHC